MTTDDYYAVHSGGHGEPNGHRDPSLRSGTGARTHDAGITLVELVVAMVVISIAVTGVMLVINYTTLHSADPVLRHQAIAVAEAYMEEITLKNYSDPDVDPATNPAPCPPDSPREGHRKDYDNVCDYNELEHSGARDQESDVMDDPIIGLEKYDVAVRVLSQDYGPAGVQVEGLKIDVIVTDPAGESLTLSGYRADF